MAEKSPRFAGARLQGFLSNGSQFVDPEGPPERIVVRTTAVLERAYKPAGVTDSSGHQLGGLTPEGDVCPQFASRNVPMTV